ncbi:MAG: hypothetical protein J6W33_01535 [Spirochaetia bacterium]|nr:hypothetical protein [Spirochaetia bacterium]
MTRTEAIFVLECVEAHGLADDARKMAIEALKVEPTLYGYKLEHLAFVAALLQNKEVSEETLTDVFNSVDRIAGMILKEVKEQTIQAFIENEVEE